MDFCGKLTRIWYNCGIRSATKEKGVFLFQYINVVYVDTFLMRKKKGNHFRN